MIRKRVICAKHHRVMSITEVASWAIYMDGDMKLTTIYAMNLLLIKEHYEIFNNMDFVSHFPTEANKNMNINRKL